MASHKCGQNWDIENLEEQPLCLDDPGAKELLDHIAEELAKEWLASFNEESTLDEETSSRSFRCVPKGKVK